MIKIYVSLIILLNGVEVIQKRLEQVLHCFITPDAFHRLGFIFFTIMAKEIQLTQGKVAIVDDADFEELNKLKWFADKQGDNYYAVRKSLRINGKYINQKMHRIIIGEKLGVHTDHINNNTLDNRRCNLRICTHQQNMWNKPKSKANNSGYKGVFYLKSSKMYRATITINGKTIYLGTFYYIKQAAIAYNLAAKKYYGEFANVNKVE